jgi:hypothetical protein
MAETVTIEWACGHEDTVFVIDGREPWMQQVAARGGLRRASKSERWRPASRAAPPTEGDGDERAERADRGRRGDLAGTDRGQGPQAGQGREDAPAEADGQGLQVPGRDPRSSRALPLAAPTPPGGGAREALAARGG